MAPQRADPARELGEIAQERTAGADFAAVEARATHAVGLNVDRLFCDAGRVAQHVHEQVVATDLAEEALVVPGFLVAPDRPLAEAARGEAAGGDQAQMAHALSEPPGEARGDRAA